MSDITYFATLSQQFDFLATKLNLYIALSLLLALMACAPSCNPAVVQAGFVARISQEQPLMVSYEDSISLLLNLQQNSRLLNYQGKIISVTELRAGQRVWLRGDLLAGYPQEVALVELRLLP